MLAPIKWLSAMHQKPSLNGRNMESDRLCLILSNHTCKKFLWKIWQPR